MITISGLIIGAVLSILIWVGHYLIYQRQPASEGEGSGWFQPGHWSRTPTLWITGTVGVLLVLFVLLGVWAKLEPILQKENTTVSFYNLPLDKDGFVLLPPEVSTVTFIPDEMTVQAIEFYAATRNGSGRGKAVGYCTSFSPVMETEGGTGSTRRSDPKVRRVILTLQGRKQWDEGKGFSPFGLKDEKNLKLENREVTVYFKVNRYNLKRAGRGMRLMIEPSPPSAWGVYEVRLKKTKTTETLH